MGEPLSPIGVPLTPSEAQTRTGITLARAMLELARSQALGTREGSPSPGYEVHRGGTAPNGSRTRRVMARAELA